MSPLDVVVSGEDSFQALLEAAPDAMVITDQTGKIRLVNAQTEVMFGYPRAELLGREVEMLVPGRLRDAHRAHRDQYGLNGVVRPMGAGLELRGRRRGGSEFPVEIRLSPMRTADGVLITAAVRDVSDRKAAEQRIRELAMIVESSQDAILTKTLDGTITYWNAAAARLYGYTAAEIVGRHVSVLAPSDRLKEIDTLLTRLRAGDRISRFETLRRTKSGVLLDVDILLWPVCDPDGTPVGACAIVRDITARKRTEEEATRLFEQQRHVAMTLQGALMGPVGAVPGVPSASRYLPAAQGGVGGDWFDLVALGGGRTGVLIGDVMGRGLEAATVMGRLRSAANALALTGMAPRQLMQSLELVARDIPDQLTTCCYLIIDACAGEVTVCSAGHLPVLLVNQDGSVRQLPVEVSPPLGLGDIPHRQAVVPVEPGATLVLYTDGLVERHDRDIYEQVTALENEVHKIFGAPPGGAPPGLEEAADAILAAFRPEATEKPDDVTLLLAGVPGGPLSRWAAAIAPEPSSVGVARNCVSDTLAQWGKQDLADVACLLVSEVLTNAVRHARALVELHVYLTEGEILFEITDDHPRLPQRRSPGPDEEAGRGLILVEALAASWGARPTDTGKVVWFTLRVSAGVSS